MAHLGMMDLHTPVTPTATTSAPHTCRWCNGLHTGTCPKVKAIEYHPNGAVKRVEFR